MGNDQSDYYDNGDDNSLKTQEIKFEDKMVVIRNKIIDDKGRNNILKNGNIVVWKMCITINGVFVYVKLRVPEGAERVTPLWNKNNDGIPPKSRVEYAFVEDIIGKDGNSYDTCYPFVNEYPKVSLNFPYVKGEITKFMDTSNINYIFNNSIEYDCVPGIHVQKYQDQCDYWAEKYNNPQILS